MTKKLGLLLTNIGTPDAPTVPAVRRYLAEFLADPRVVSLPPLLWLPILHGVILRLRPIKSVQLYQKIWTEQGSPLLSHSLQLAEALQQKLKQHYNTDIPVTLGMRYGKPSIRHGLEFLRAQQVEHICILPLYPQFSATTTASTLDAVSLTLKKWNNIPSLSFINYYADHPSYIEAITQSIRQHWQKTKKEHLLFSFHGIPQKYIEAGDPYYDQCQLTVKLITSRLQLAASEWSLSFQSRVGPTKWLEPYTDKVLASLPQQGIKNLQVVCPGFAVDCLETLEEIAIRGKEQFLEAGGLSFEYISALNSSSDHTNALLQIISDNLSHDRCQTAVMPACL